MLEAEAVDRTQEKAVVRFDPQLSEPVCDLVYTFVAVGDTGNAAGTRNLFQQQARYLYRKGFGLTASRPCERRTASRRLKDPPLLLVPPQIVLECLVSFAKAVVGRRW